MASPREDGMATAEYTVGTLGAVMVAALLFKLGLDDGWYWDQLRDVIERALDPGRLLDLAKDASRFLLGR